MLRCRVQKCSHLTEEPHDRNAATLNTSTKSRLDRALSLFTEVRAGEGATAALMLVNIFLLLVCYSVIKTVREPLILLGGGAEVRSYAAAGQALLLMGFVPLYSLVASRVDRLKLIVGVTLFFVACIELFAAAVAAGVPFVGVAFFIWVGIFNISLVAQFWSFANDIYRKEAGSRLFPIIMIGMTAGAPLGSIVAARLFRSGASPEAILQVSAVLLLASIAVYLVVNGREARRAEGPAEPLAEGNGFALVLGNPYLRLIAALVVLLNVVNTTGEYIVARMLTSHVQELALADPGLDKQAFIGAFTGDYQFWVNVTALLLQAFVTSRLVRVRGLQGALLALPLIALGGYAIVAAGAGFAMVRWIKTAENATDYSIMNTARQLLWLPTTRDEKYKAKQAIDTFAVRAGDLLSASVVFAGAGVLHLDLAQFALANVFLTIAWTGVALMIVRPVHLSPAFALRPLAGAAAVLALLLVPSTANAQHSREGQLAAERAEKATKLAPYQPNTLERRLSMVERSLFSERVFHPFIGSIYQGGGLAVGPGFRKPFGDTGLVTAYAAFSIRSYAAAEAKVRLPEFADRRVRVELRAERLHAPTVDFYGIGADSSRDLRRSFSMDTTMAGAMGRVQVARRVAVGGSLDWMQTRAEGPDNDASLKLVAPTYRRTGAFAEFDSRTSPGYTRSGDHNRID